MGPVAEREQDWSFGVLGPVDRKKVRDADLAVTSKDALIIQIARVVDTVHRSFSFVGPRVSLSPHPYYSHSTIVYKTRAPNCQNTCRSSTQAFRAPGRPALEVIERVFIDPEPPVFHDRGDLARMDQGGDPLLGNVQPLGGSFHGDGFAQLHTTNYRRSAIIRQSRPARGIRYPES